MKSDIKNINDIKNLVNSFYNKVQVDETIGHIFNDIMKVNWDLHLPKMYNFWGFILLGEGSYKGQMMQVHLDVNEKIKLKDHHFNQWLNLWNENVDDLFSGEIAELAKEKGRVMRYILSSKIEHFNQMSE